MSDPERDPSVRRAIDELRTIPPSRPADIRRIVAAAAAARVAPSDDEPRLPSVDHVGSRGIGRWAVGAAAAAMIVAAVALIRGTGANNVASTPTRAVRPTSEPVAASAGPIQVAANSTTESAPINHQFVFNGKGAHRVSVVGDFNRWNASSAPMTRASDGELWSITIPVAPGRHMYGFMVDDSIFVLDPYAQKARDPDLGTNSSVIIVGKP